MIKYEKRSLTSFLLLMATIYSFTSFFDSLAFNLTPIHVDIAHAAMTTTNHKRYVILYPLNKANDHLIEYTLYPIVQTF